MQHMEYREGCAMLRKAGFTELEIERLSKLRTAYHEEELHLISETPPCRSWFNRAIRKLGSLCFQLAYSGSIFWPYDHTVF